MEDEGGQMEGAERVQSSRVTRCRYHQRQDAGGSCLIWAYYVSTDAPHEVCSPHHATPNACTAGMGR